MVGFWGVTFPKRYQIESFDDFADKEKFIDISRWFEDGSDEFLTYAKFRCHKYYSKSRK